MPDREWTSDDTPGDIPDRMIDIKQTAYLREIAAGIVGTIFTQILAQLEAINENTDELEITLENVENINQTINLNTDELEMLQSLLNGITTYANEPFLDGFSASLAINIGPPKTANFNGTPLGEVWTDHLKPGDHVAFSGWPNTNGSFLVTEVGETYFRFTEYDGGDTIEGGYALSPGGRVTPWIASSENLTTLKAILTAVTGVATESTLTTLATDAKLELVRLLLVSIDANDFATEATLDSILSKQAEFRDAVAGAYPMKAVHPDGDDVSPTDPFPVVDYPRDTAPNGMVQTFNSGSAQQLNPLSAEKYIRIQADDDNDDDVYLSYSPLMTPSSAEYRLAPGQVTFIEIDEASNLYGQEGSGSQSIRVSGV